MNWYKKIKISSIKTASISFRLPDSYKVAQPMTVLDLCHDLTKFFYRGATSQHGTAPTMNQISPDGHQAFEFNGTINVYPTQRIEPPENANEELYDNFWQLSEEEKIKRGGRVFDNSLENMMPVIDEWINNKKTEGYVISKKQDISNSTEGPVLRINIQNNPSEEYDQLPEVQMSNANAVLILGMLGIANGDQGGSISPQDLKNRIESKSQEEIRDNAQEPSVQQSEEGPTMVDFGAPADYIDEKLQQLYSFVDFAISNGYQEVHWG